MPKTSISMLRTNVRYVVICAGDGPLRSSIDDLEDAYIWLKGFDETERTKKLKLDFCGTQPEIFKQKSSSFLGLSTEHVLHRCQFSLTCFSITSRSLV
jgi:hypothetical protein